MIKMPSRKIKISLKVKLKTSERAVKAFKFSVQNSKTKKRSNRINSIEDKSEAILHQEYQKRKLQQQSDPTLKVPYTLLDGFTYNTRGYFASNEQNIHSYYMFNNRIKDLLFHYFQR